MIPFTVIKTRFESRMYKYTSIREALQLIYKGEGMRGLTCGLLPTLLRDAPFSGLYFMMYTSTKNLVPKDWMDGTSNLAPYVRFSCGIIAGCGASFITQPADVIKTKMQLFPNKFQSIPPVIAYVYQKYGVKGYFKGLMPRMVRRTLVAAMSWTVYEQLMHNIGLK
jgi:solute carrier family 25 protein 38